MLVIVSDRKKVEKMYDYNKKGFAQQQAGALIQNLLLSLTEKKIDNCWIGFFDDDIAKRAVSVPEDNDIEAIIALGVASKIKQINKDKPELENIVFFDKWGKKMMEPESRVRGEWA
jgi:nitroreductase